MNLSALEFMMKEFPEIKEKDEMRKIVGRYGITGQQQVWKLVNVVNVVDWTDLLIDIHQTLCIVDLPNQKLVWWSEM